LVGQLLLPNGSGSRGVEVLLEVAPSAEEPRTVWVLFDDEGRFSQAFRGTLTLLQVTTGGLDVFRIDAADLPAPNEAGRIDVGAINLRERLAARRFLLRGSEAEPSAVARVGMWFGPPPVGPQGEPVSLGSRQFPEVALGTELEWLLPHDARDVYFLVERPDGPSRGIERRSGQQQLFGPFTAAEFPTELVLR
jgi:hypothetical protein